MEVTGEGSDHQGEGMGVRPASVASTAPPARGCSAASAGPAVVQPGDQILITMRILRNCPFNCCCAYFGFQKVNWSQH